MGRLCLDRRGVGEKEVENEEEEKDDLLYRDEEEEERQADHCYVFDEAS